MTGFGRARRDTATGFIDVEARSVNNRFLKLQLRLGRELLSHESEFEEIVRKKVARGTVSVTVRLRDESIAAPLRIDADLAKKLGEASLELARTLGLKPLSSVSEILQLPGIVVQDEAPEDITPAVLEDVKSTVREAVDGLTAMRDAEGATLALELLQIQARVLVALNEIKRRSPATVVEYREKLRKRLENLLIDTPRQMVADDPALLREVAVLADRTDITEEIQRLESHLHQFSRLLGEDQVGRKIEFLLQEMLRETNTIGSKASDAQIAQRVVEIKSELERLREQAQNVE